MKSPITFAKIVATPTLTSWSQAYNAGNLAAVIALTQKTVENTDKPAEIEDTLSLPALGKELLNTLEAEYFTLETKNLTTIKQAIMTTVEKASEEITVSLGVSVIIENVLYLCIFGKGKILMKRKGKLGTLLEHDEDNTITSGSGYIENGDIVILETPQFAEIISQDDLIPCLSHDRLSEMADILSPIIHEKQHGAASAIAFSYQDETPETSEIDYPVTKQEDISAPLAYQTQEEEKVEKKEQIFEENVQDPESIDGTHETYAARDDEPLKGIPGPTLRLPHSKRLFLTIAIIVGIVLVASIFFSISKQKDAARQALFASTVVPAQKKYDEGQSLMELNKNVARDDFQQAKNMLTDAIAKFPPDSKEAKDAQDLMKKINDSLTVASQINSTDAKAVDATTSPLLSARIKHADAKYVTSDDKNVYIGDNTGIIAIAKKDGKESSVIKNSDSWKDIGGLGTYVGNFYVLDKSSGILKYVSSGSTFSKSNYFTTAPDLSHVQSLTIDGSIWLISSDGIISKFTKGKADDFGTKGLDKPFKNPTRIYTNVDSDNVYVLDTGNKRIVILDKKGTYQSQYQAGVIGSAQDFDVVEKDKKVYVLSGGKVYEIDIK